MTGRALAGVVVVALAAAVLAAPAAHAADPCRPVRPACTAGADGRLPPAARALATAESGRALRGIGLASYTGLLGARKGAATEAKLDAELVRRLTTASIPLGARVAAGAGRRGVSAAASGLDTVIDLRQRAGSPRARMYRRMHVELDVDRCPQQLSPLSRVSDEQIRIAASYEVTATWYEGATRVSEGLIIRLYPTQANADVNQDARFQRFKSFSAEARVDRFGDRRTPGQRIRRHATAVNIDVDPAEVGWNATEASREAGWDEFTGSSRPPGREPALLSERAYADLVKAFMKLVDAELVKAVAKAERVWQTPNACARVAWEPASGTAEVAPGAQALVTGRIVPNGGRGLNGLREQWAPTASLGTLVERLRAGSAEGEPLQVRVEGADRPENGLSVRLRYRTPSTIGVVEGEWTAKGRSLPRYVIDFLNGNQASTLTGSAPDVNCPVILGDQTRKTVDGPPPAPDPSNKIEGDDVQGFNGFIGAVVNGTEFGNFKGCDITMGGPSPPECSFPGSADVPVSVGFIIQIPPNSTTATLRWLVGPGSVGILTGGASCYFPATTGTADATDGVTTVPKSVFFADGPQTVSVDGTFLRHAVSLTLNSHFIYSITFHAVYD